jgi:hypothetical protein
MDVSGDRKDFLRIYENLPNGPIKNAVDEIIQSLKNDLVVGEHVKHGQIPNITSSATMFSRCTEQDYRNIGG